MYFFIDCKAHLLETILNIFMTKQLYTYEW